jgi:hypothetical protein
MCSFRSIWQSKSSTTSTFTPPAPETSEKSRCSLAEPVDTPVSIQFGEQQSGAGAIELPTKTLIFIFTGSGTLNFHADRRYRVIEVNTAVSGMYFTTWDRGAADPPGGQVVGQLGGYLCGRLGGSSNGGSLTRISHVLEVGDYLYCQNNTGAVAYANAVLQILL